MSQPGKKKDPTDSASQGAESTHGEAAALRYEADCWVMLKVALGGFFGMVAGGLLAALPGLPPALVGLGVLVAQVAGGASIGAFGAWSHATWKLQREAEPEVLRAALRGGPGRLRPWVFGLVMAGAGALFLVQVGRALTMRDLRHSGVRAHTEAVRRALEGSRR